MHYLPGTAAKCSFDGDPLRGQTLQDQMGRRQSRVRGHGSRPISEKITQVFEKDSSKWATSQRAGKGKEELAPQRPQIDETGQHRLPGVAGCAESLLCPAATNLPQAPQFCHPFPPTPFEQDRKMATREPTQLECPKVLML